MPSHVFGRGCEIFKGENAEEETDSTLLTVHYIRRPVIAAAPQLNAIHSTSVFSEISLQADGMVWKTFMNI